MLIDMKLWQVKAWELRHEISLQSSQILVSKEALDSILLPKSGTSTLDIFWSTEGSPVTLQIYADSLSLLPSMGSSW